MPASAARLPDAFVRLAPPADDGGAETDEGSGGHAVEPAAPLDIAPGRIDHLTVGIELHLIEGGIAHPHRGRPGVALEVIENRLRNARLAVDVIQDVKLGPGEPRRVQ